MSHEPTTNPCFFDHTCPDDAPCPNTEVRPLPGNPPVLSLAEQKLKELDEIVKDYEDDEPYECAQEAAECFEKYLERIRTILKR